MIIRNESVLLKKHCDEILSACNKAGYRKASLKTTERAILRSQGLSEESAVVSTDNDDSLKRDLFTNNWYDETRRGGMTSFPKREDLPTVYPFIEDFIHEQNRIFYGANISSLDLQVAEYTEGQVGFDWHIDEPIYPTSDNLWGGRKITFVFQLSEESDYEGGSLIALPTMLIPRESSQRSIFIDSSNFEHRIGHVPNQEVVTLNKENSVINQDNNDFGQESFVLSKKIGSFMAFPSFYSHTVTPVSSGKRYSLTVWANGPKWV